MELEIEKYGYDTFENCPACGEWRMRVRIKGPDRLMHSSGMMWITTGDWYSFNLRCLKCGYSNSFFELEPFADTEEEVLEGILSSERQRLRKTGEASERI